MYEINRAAVIGAGTMGLGIAGQLANAGGDVDAGTMMSEEDICGLERRAFLSLAKTSETRARVEHMLDHGSPLRN